MMTATRQNRRRPQILLAASDVEMRSHLTHLLGRSGYEVCSCDSLTSLLESVDTDSKNFDLVVCQMDLLKDAAGAVLEHLQHRGWPAPLVLIRRVASTKDTALARRLSAAAILESDSNSAQQLAMVRKIVPVAGPAAATCSPS